MFEWDPNKDKLNRQKHRVSFYKAQYAFVDPNRIILEDVSHSSETETRYYCLGEVDGGVLTVRFTFREDRIRIIGAGYWRRGKKIYEEQNRLHR